MAARLLVRAVVVVVCWLLNALATCKCISGTVVRADPSLRYPSMLLGRGATNRLLLVHQMEDHLVGLVVKASASRAEDPGFESRLRRDFVRGRVIPVTQKLALRWLPCQAPGVIGSALGLVGPVSVYCDRVRQKVGSATSISEWQHVKLCEQIRP